MNSINIIMFHYLKLSLFDYRKQLENLKKCQWNLTSIFQKETFDFCYPANFDFNTILYYAYSIFCVAKIMYRVQDYEQRCSSSYMWVSHFTHV